MQAQGLLSSDAESTAREIQAASNGVLSLLMQGVAAKDLKETGNFLFESVQARLTA